MRIQHFATSKQKLAFQQSGVILPAVVLVMLALTISTLALASFSINQISTTKRQTYETGGLLVAEAGAEQTLSQLNQQNNFTGYTTEQELFNNGSQGKGAYTTTVTNGTLQNEKIITSTGKIYRPNSNSANITRKVRLIVVGTSTTNYSVQTGPGGLIMSNSATIANGNVYINGYLQMSNSARIGSSSNPLKVWVAHNNCPAGGGSTYPAQCTSGQPITLTNSAQIFGEVRATNQTSGNGMSSPGLIAGSSAPPVSLPNYDRQAQVDAVANNLTGAAASCSNGQTRTWNANTKITGNVTISNNCQVTVNGNVWITGNFNISNSASIKVGSSVATVPTVMIDGSSGATFSNSSSVLANASNIGFQFITFHSTASCSPNCSDVTGTSLYNSRNLTTISISNSSLGAGSTYYARWSKIQVNNGGAVGAILGQTIQLSNSGNISFGTQLSSGTSVWSIKNYQQIFD